MALLGFGVLAGALITSDQDDEDDIEPILVGMDETTVGTEEDDVFEIDPDLLSDPEGSVAAVNSISGGAGNDTFDLFDPLDDTVLPEEGLTFTDVVLSGGEGDDTISIAAKDSEIFGGSGDDEINIYDTEFTMAYGGEGDDTIAGFTDESTIDVSFILFGEEGNDTLDARDQGAGGIIGGVGDDTLLAGQTTQPGQYDYNPHITANAGDGNDTLVYEGTGNAQDSWEFATFIGGENEDVFALQLYEADLSSVYDQDLASGEEFKTFTAADEPVQVHAARLDDFEIGEEIILDLRVSDSNYSVGDIRLERSDSPFQTYIIIPYVSDTLIDQEVIISVDEHDVTLDDISFANIDHLTT